MAKIATTSRKKTASVEKPTPAERYDIPEFRKRLAGLLEEKGISQRQLANHLKRDPRQINLTIIGTLKPDLKMLAGIANYLNISLDWLIGVGRKPWKGEISAETAVSFKLNDDPTMDVSFPAPLVRRLFGSDVDSVHLISVDSQDMAPTFQEGDLVFLKKTGFQNRSGVYLLKTGKINVIRRLSFDAISNKANISMDAQPEEGHQTTLDKISVVGQISRVQYFG